MFGGPTAAEARAALERRAEGGMATDVAQRPAGSDGGLFDADARKQIGFAARDGADETIEQVIKGLEAEEAALKALRDCL